jgi:hypothetical protein
MPVYYFHVRDEKLLLEDKEGTDLPDLASAFTEARASAREIAADSLKANEAIDGRQIEIVDATGTVLGAIPIREVVDR